MGLGRMWLMTVVLSSVLTVQAVHAEELAEEQPLEEPAGESVEAPVEPPPAPDVTPILEQARELLRAQKLLEAKEAYKQFLSASADAELRETARKEFEDLQLKILFSNTVTPDSILYEVKAGDSLYKIAKAHNTTVELVMKSNGLTASTIFPAMKLKVVTAPFFIRIDRSDNRLELYEGEELIKAYTVATGENLSTPLGTFTIESKLEHPTWYHAGAIVPSGSPDNILGSRWLGFSLPKYGIHGTTLPESIGTHSTAGCVRMLNDEVEELYAIVPLKTKVEIVA